MTNTEGEVLYVKPLDGATVREAEFADLLTGSGSLGLTVGDDPAGLKITEDGCYELRTFGPAGAEYARQILRYYFWEIVRVVQWDDWSLDD